MGVKYWCVTLMLFVMVANGQWWHYYGNNKPMKYIPTFYSGPVTNSSGTFYYPGPNTETDHYTEADVNHAADEKTAAIEAEAAENRAWYARIMSKNRLRKAKTTPLFKLTTEEPKDHTELPLTTPYHELHDPESYQQHPKNVLRQMSDQLEKHGGLQPKTASLPLPTPVPRITLTQPMTPVTKQATETTNNLLQPDIPRAKLH